MINFQLDEPINEISEDEFGRKKIVEEISDFIIEKSKQSHSCITIGLYGSWGEGKTSVLNMIQHKLKEYQGDKKLKTIQFNPWMFKDQESLLIDFFKLFQQGCSSEEVINAVKKYGPFVSMGIEKVLNLCVPGAGSILGGGINSIISKMPDFKKSVGELKKEIDSQIVSSKQHVVVIIDDIDRLDNEEMHAVFTLIKQTASFKNTIFIVAMDKDIVANSLAKYFDNGKEVRCGYDFLEKIVQLPIDLPQTKKSGLLDMFKNKNPLIYNHNEAANKLERLEYEEAEKDIEQYIMPLIHTGRKVILLSNILNISIPMIGKEVNLSDLCLLESLKLFCPVAYNTIKRNKILVCGEFVDMKQTIEQIRVKSDSDKESTKKESERDVFIKKLTDSIETDDKFLLVLLINQLLEIESNATIVKEEKRLTSRHYFDKYFIFDCPDDEISEEMKDILIEKIKSGDGNTILPYIESLIQIYGSKEMSRIIYNIESQQYQINISNENLKELCISLSQLNENKSRTDALERLEITRWEYSIQQIMDSLFIHDKDGNVKQDDSGPVRDKDMTITIFGEIVHKASPIFSLIFLEYYYRKSVYRANSAIEKFMLEGIHSFADNDEIAYFSLNPSLMIDICTIWKSINEDDYQKYMDEYANEKTLNVPKLVLYECGGNDRTGYDRLCNCFNKDFLYQSIKDIYNKDVSDRESKAMKNFVSYYEADTNKK